jgi:NAD dependent epimerase/dehydratase family enzyme
VIYGREVKLIKAARWLMRRRLMAIWSIPTWVHLLALPDFLNIVRIAIENEHLSGIYNLCDDEPLLLRDFLNRLAEHWNYSKLWHMPSWTFYATAVLCETLATVFHTATPLTRDIVRMGMTSVVADTSRMKSEIVADLMYPTLAHGLAIL